MNGASIGIPMTRYSFACGHYTKINQFSFWLLRCGYNSCISIMLSCLWSSSRWAYVYNVKPTLAWPGILESTWMAVSYPISLVAKCMKREVRKSGCIAFAGGYSPWNQKAMRVKLLFRPLRRIWSGFGSIPNCDRSRKESIGHVLTDPGPVGGRIGRRTK